MRGVKFPLRRPQCMPLQYKEPSVSSGGFSYFVELLSMILEQFEISSILYDLRD